MKRVTVLIADDHGILREGLRALLETDGNLKVVGEAQDGHEAVALAKKLRPDVVLMDIVMPRLDGLEATRQVLNALPATKVLILSAHNDYEHVKGAFESNAAGYLPKETSAREIRWAIGQILKGTRVFLPSNSGRFDRLNSQLLLLNQNAVHLTSREREVLRLIAQGKANKETAALLGIGIKTVEKHREHLMEKLNIHETAGLTRYAIAEGIIESQ